jgi:hypothetical protein
MLPTAGNFLQATLFLVERTGIPEGRRHCKLCIIGHVQGVVPGHSCTVCCVAGICTCLWSSMLLLSDQPLLMLMLLPAATCCYLLLLPAAGACCCCCCLMLLLLLLPPPPHHTHTLTSC